MSWTDDLWAILATNGTYLRVRANTRDSFIPAHDLERFRIAAKDAYIGLCPRKLNATDGQAPASCVWAHYQHAGQPLPGIPALIFDHGATRTAIWWLAKPLPVTAHPDDCWLRKANRRLHYKLTGLQGVSPTTDPLWLLPPGDLVCRHAFMSDTTFLKALRQSPWERNAHRRLARQH